MPTRLRLIKVEIKINDAMTEFARVSVSPCNKRIPVAIVCTKSTNADGQTIHNEYFQIALKKIILIKKHN